MQHFTGTEYIIAPGHVCVHTMISKKDLYWSMVIVLILKRMCSRCLCVLFLHLYFRLEIFQTNPLLRKRSDGIQCYVFTIFTLSLLHTPLSIVFWIRVFRINMYYEIALGVDQSGIQVQDSSVGKCFSCFFAS